MTLASKPRLVPRKTLINLTFYTKNNSVLTLLEWNDSLYSKLSVQFFINQSKHEYQF